MEPITNLKEASSFEKATKNTHTFDKWYELLNELSEEMFLNDWEGGLGLERDTAQACYDIGETVMETCVWIMDKYDLDDCRKLI